MALLHRAKLHPTKLELLAAWLPSRRWYQGQTVAGLELVAAYRFDDPAGMVGIETMLVRAGDGPIHQVPVTYRDAPLDGDDRLIGTAEHSVLGQRWVYDACRDPAYVAALAVAILADGGQAEQFFEVDGRREVRQPTMTITASGSADADIPAIGSLHRIDDDDPTRIVTDRVELAVVRRLDATVALPGVTLTGTWGGHTPLSLACASMR